MRLQPIVLKLRAANIERFSNRVAGSAELALAKRATLKADMAFVIPLDETSTRNSQQNTIQQKVEERIGIVVAIANDLSSKDKLGTVAYDIVHDVREDLWKALLGWQVTGTRSVLSYGGGRLVGINDAYLWYQYIFVATTEVDTEDGIELEEADYFNTIFTDYLLSPSRRLPMLDDLPISDPDMSQLIDLNEDLDAGAFDRDFSKAFDVYKVGRYDE